MHDYLENAIPIPISRSTNDNQIIDIAQYRTKKEK